MPSWSFLLVVPVVIVLSLALLWWEFRHAEDEPTEHEVPPWKGWHRL